MTTDSSILLLDAGASQILSPPGGPSAFPASFVSEAAKLIRPTITDPELYGCGKWNQACGKHTPFFANPQEDPPKKINPFTGWREYRRIGEGNLIEHGSGVRPYFRVNVAEERVEAWDHSGLLRLLSEVYSVTGTENQPGEEDAFLTAMTSDRPPLTPAKARKFQKGKPGKDPMTGDDLVTRLKRFLVSSRQNTLVFRLLHRAIITKYVPVYEFEFTVDIDGDDGYEKSLTAAHAMTLAHRMIDEVFGPAGIATYIEVSRNRGGAYIHFRMRRESDPAAVNELLAHLLARLEQIKHDDLVAHACKIGGKLATWKMNSSYDEAAADEWQNGDESRPTIGEDYHWRKHHAEMLNADGTRVVWAYQPTMEPRVLTGIDLMTFPLHDLRADADGGRDRVARYTEYAAQPAAPESTLRTFLGVAGAAETSKKQKKKRTAQRRAATITISETDDYRSALLKIYGPGQALNISILLDTSASEHARFGAASRMAMHRNHGDIDAATVEALELVELGGATGEVGPATGPRTPERIHHVRRCCEFWAKTYDDSMVGSGDTAWLFGTGEVAQANLNDMTERLTGRISQAIIDEVECRHPDSAALKREMIAAAYMVMLNNTHTDQLREVPRDSIIAGMDILGFDITDHTAAALIGLLTDPRLGLLAQIMRVKRDQDGDITREYDYGPGECRLYALRAQAIIPAWLLEAGVPIQYIQMAQRPSAAEGPSGDEGTQANKSPTPTTYPKTMCAVDIDETEYDVVVMGPEWTECDDFLAEIGNSPPNC